MCRLDHRIAVLVLILLLPFGLHADESRARDVFVFGDSLSDTGNLASLIGPFPSPPFYMNRVSNGPVAVETLARGLGASAAASLHLVGPAVGTNYAVAGARARGGDVIDLAFQTELFLANHGGVAPSAALYVIMIGGNDIRDARDSADDLLAAQITRDAAQAVIGQARRLAMAGARNFLLVNAPDIGMIPETRLLAAQTGRPDLPRRASRLTRMFNRYLKHNAELFEHAEDIDPEVELFKLDKVFRKIVRHASRLGFTNTTDPCFFTSLMQPNPECDFDRFIFFDEIHPTARVHFLVGSAMLKYLDEDIGGEELELVRHSRSAHDD